jgi:hypothetical protein
VGGRRSFIFSGHDKKNGVGESSEAKERKEV